MMSILVHEAQKLTGHDSLTSTSRSYPKTSDHFDDYISAVYAIEEDDVYGELAERDMLRKDSV